MKEGTSRQHAKKEEDKGHDLSGQNSQWGHFTLSHMCQWALAPAPSLRGRSPSLLEPESLHGATLS